MKKRILMFCTLLLLFSAMGIMAQEGPSPTTEDDNECYTGGLMEGKCEILWEWECGWYLHVWVENGGWSNEDQFFPERCESVLPPKPKAPPSSSSEGPAPEPPSVTQICRTFTDLFQVDICLSSDNTGFFREEGIITGRSIFGNFGSEGNCPPAPTGFTLDDFFDTEEEYSSETGFGYSYSLFTNNELFNVLGLGPDECYYFPEGAPLTGTSLSTFAMSHIR